jgi:DNA-binding MarR family transcriptional regulator
MPKPITKAGSTFASPLAALPESAWLLLDNQLCFALYSASLTMTKVYKPLLAKFGVTYPQYLVLLVLWEQDKRTVSELGDRLFLDSGTLTPLLKRLEALNYISRDRDAEDERRVIVSLTSEGKRLQKQALAVPQQICGASQCSLPVLVSLTEQLTSLRASLASHVENERT